MTSILQVIIVEFGSIALGVVEGGLSADRWGLCLLIGAVPLPVQQIINIIFRIGSNFHGSRNSSRRNTDHRMVLQLKKESAGYVDHADSL